MDWHSEAHSHAASRLSETFARRIFTSYRACELAIGLDQAIQDNVSCYASSQSIGWIGRREISLGWPRQV